MRTICYDGVGALEFGNHTEKQFLNVMKGKLNKSRCRHYFKSLKCKSCKKSSRFTKSLGKKYWKNDLEPPLPLLEKMEALEKMCKKCKYNTKKNCTLKQFKTWSGARWGKCKYTV